MTDHVGQQLGNYRLSRLLGKGGFAEVYLGEHIYLKTPAAIKLLQTKVANEEDLQSFLKEAQTIAQLVHPHIVQVLDFNVEEEMPFLVMSYAPNGTLRQRHPRATPLPLSTIVSYVKQLADALQYAHNEKLIHRDIKPENMLVGRNNEVLLSDFGIALMAQSSRYQSLQEMVGTIPYMAPEQIQGKPRPASDQYSLGVVVYEWLCGERPFYGSFTELCAQHMFASPPSMREKLPLLSPIVEEVVMTALAKDPKQRFASIRAFANALEQASQVRQGQIFSGIPEPLSPPLIGSSASTSSAPTLPLPQDVPFVLPAQPNRPEPQVPLPEPTRPVSSGLPTLQPVTPASKRSLHRLSHSRYLAALLVVLAFLIVGGTSLIYRAMSMNNTHLPTTASGYDTFVAANGIMLGFDAQHSGFNPYEQALSPSNISKLNQVWGYPDVGAFESSPVTANGVVYIGSIDKSFYAFDARTGSKLWSFLTKGPIYSSPTVVGDILYASSLDEYALTTVANGVVYFGSGDGSLYALDAQTGSKIWSFPTRSWIVSSPAVANGVVYTSSTDDSLYALDVNTGSKIWSFTAGGLNYSSPVVAKGVVYAGSFDHSLYALDARTGRKLWSFSTGDAIFSSPAIAKGVVYIGSEDHSLYALDARSGTKLWSFSTGDRINSSPAIANGVVYIGSEDHSLYALDARTGRKLWSFPTGDYIGSSPAIANGVVYIGSGDRSLYALDAHTGHKLWSFLTGYIVFSSPTITNGIVYVGSDDDSLYALDARSGSKLWSFSTGGSIASSPAVANGIVYIDSDDGKLYAFHLG